jgi:DNA (cytosine-5)-methyltransferase 1
MRHLDLFSGIGGFSLAARWMGWETVAQVEWDKWCQKVLAKNFPDSLRFGDIVEFNKMLQDGRITTDTEGAGLLREKELENNSENNGTGRGCNSSDLHKISKQDGEIITDTSSRKSWQSKTRNRREDISGRSEETYGKLSIGRIDIITGGFPCQPFSHAGKRKGVADERYLWPEMLRTIRILKPSFVVGENVAGLVSMDGGKTLDSILADLENEGYQVESFIIPACAIGAWHRRDRIWIIAHKSGEGLEGQFGEELQRGGVRFAYSHKDVSDTDNGRFKKQRLNKSVQSNIEREAEGIESEYSGGCNGRELKARAGQLKSELGRMVNGIPLELDGYWNREPDGIPRVATGVKNRVDRLKGLGNAIVPQVAFQIFKAIESVDNFVENNTYR